MVGLRVASYDYPSRFVHMTAGVALPLALAAPVVYLLGARAGLSPPGRLRRGRPVWRV